MKKFLVAFFCMILSVHGVFAANMLENATFDTANSWELNYYFKDRGSSVQMVNHDGQNVICMQSESENHVTATQKVAVEANAIYKITAEVETENVSEKGGGACIGIYNQLCYSNTVKGSSGGYETLTLYVQPKGTELPVMLSLGGHGDEASGTAYFRNPQMEQITWEQVPEDATVWQVSADGAEDTNRSQDKSYLPTTTLDAKWYTVIALLALTVLGTFYYVWFKKQ